MSLAPLMSGEKSVNRGEFEALVSRVSKLESTVKMLSAPRTMDQARLPGKLWADSAGEPYYHRYNDLSGALGQVLPMVSSTAQYIESLTGFEFRKSTAVDALMFSASLAVIGGGLAALTHLPIVQTAGVAFLGGGAFVLGGLILWNRILIHKMAVGQADKSKKRQEMRVQIDQPGDHGIEFLYLNSDIEPDQIKEFARAALDGASLSVHKWTGKGALFKRGQFDDLMGELEKMNYVISARGNVGRCLNAKGRALMRGWSE